MTIRFPWRTLAILAALTAAAAPAQTADADAATIRQLLAEVHMLRLAMERSVALGPKVQLLLQRAQIQDQKVARLSRQLDDIHGQITAETAQQAKVGEELAHIERELSSESDANRRKQLEDLQVNLKSTVAGNPEPQLRAREAEIAGALQAEQAALNELNAKLDALEHQFDPH